MKKLISLIEEQIAAVQREGKPAIKVSIGLYHALLDTDTRRILYLLGASGVHLMCGK